MALSSLLTCLTLLSVGSDLRSQGLGMIAEMISIVVDRDFMKVTRFS